MIQKTKYSKYFIKGRLCAISLIKVFHFRQERDQMQNLKQDTAYNYHLWRTHNNVHTPGAAFVQY